METAMLQKYAPMVQARQKSHLVRNETRGGNLLLSVTVHPT